MRVLLTGASGFIGSHALDVLLERGEEVHAVARRVGPRRDGVSWYEADLLQSDAAATLAQEVQASHLLHLAWYAVPGRFWSAPENERWIDASLRLLRAFGEAGGRRAVIAGTCAEYEWGDPLLSEEHTPLRPATLYGACKHATQVAATAVAAQQGVSFAWGRIFFLYGPGEPEGRLVSSLVKALLNGEEFETTDGAQRRDFMHVDDVSSAFLALLASDVQGAVNISTGQATPVREIVTRVAEQLGALKLVRFGALPQRAGEPALIEGEARRLVEEVGFEPQVELADGVAETIRWWRKSSSARHSREHDRPAN